MIRLLPREQFDLGPYCLQCRLPKCTIGGKLVTSLPTSVYCHRLITFANSLNPDQAQQNVGPDLDQNCLFLKQFFFKKLIFKNIRRQKSMKNFPVGKELKKLYTNAESTIT